MICLKIDLNGHTEIMEFGVSNLYGHDIFLGFNWLKYHNPQIDWQTGHIKFNRCPDSCYPRLDVTNPEEEVEEIKEILMEGEKLLAVEIGRMEIERIKGFATEITVEMVKKMKMPLEQKIPEAYLKYRKVFKKVTFDELPPRPWDHAIELIPGSKPIDCKIYPLN
ncbi:hypothetical protein AX15_007807 [Amanita polypyramis BW_CC]|nr:hypothetical protein AX15_007807 [Amanita polypyramis BW_CC]